MRLLRWIRHRLADLWLHVRVWISTNAGLAAAMQKERERHRDLEDREAARHRWREEELQEMVRVRDERNKDLIIQVETFRSYYEAHTAVNQRTIAQAQFDPNPKPRTLQ